MKTSKFLGAIITIFATILLVGLFWGFSWLTHWNTLFFSTGSDDLIKDVYTTTYHVAYDDDTFIAHAMNYPYGEYYTFTGLNPIVAAPLQWLRHTGIANPERAVLPLINLISLLSIVLCALFLFLLLHELKLPDWYAILCALLITLMSPQLQRLGGHLSLSYYCAIPMLLYFFLRHMRSGGWGWDLANGISMILFALCHPYYIVFYIVIICGELIYLLIKRNSLPWKSNSPTLRIALSALLQLVIPLAIFYCLSHYGLPNGDRTAVPSGFYTYRARIEGILFPYGRLYFFERSKLFVYVQWEARNYVGIVSVVAMVLILWHFFRCIFKKQFADSLRHTDSSELNLMLLVATLLMLFACGMPLSWFPRNIVSYIGPIAQFRAQGRFVWLFCFVINIVAFYGLYKWWHSSKSKGRLWTLSLALLVMAAEGVAFNWQNKSWYTNTWDEWTDYDNKLPQNQWANEIDFTPYQAILTLPVFNTGSEMIYLPSQDNMFRNSALLSIKSGLPLVCHESARSDIRQAWDCAAISRTAWQPLAIADNLQDDRPLLLAVTKNQELLSPAEHKILLLADSITDIGNMVLYSLDCDALRMAHIQTVNELNTLYDSIASLESNPQIIFCPDTIRCDIHRWNTIFEKENPYAQEVEISFWMSDIFKDLYTRTKFKVEAIDSEGNATELYSEDANLSLDIVDRSAEQGLFRISVTIPDGTNIIKISNRCRESRPSPVFFHHFLIRPKDSHAATSDHRIDNIPL